MFSSRGADCDNQGRALAKAKSTKNMHKVHKMRTMKSYRYIKFDIKKPKVDGDRHSEYSGLRPSADEARHAGDSIQYPHCAGWSHCPESAAMYNEMSN